jgi:hypothetical protein
MMSDPAATLTRMPTAPLDWRSVLHGDPKPGIHWHGFTWVGRGYQLESFKFQAERTAGTAEFQSSDLPPEMTGWYLHKKRLVKATFTTPGSAAAWMRAQWDENAPTVTHLDADDTQLYHEVTVSHGKDTVWSWWLPQPGSGTKFHVAVICCPNEFWQIACPQSPK